MLVKQKGLVDKQKKQFALMGASSRTTELTVTTRESPTVRTKSPPDLLSRTNTASASVKSRLQLRDSSNPSAWESNCIHCQSTAGGCVCRQAKPIHLRLEPILRTALAVAWKAWLYRYRNSSFDSSESTEAELRFMRFEPRKDESLSSSPELFSSP
ncbi:hypothetical protein ACHAW5_009729 [Stephanodiscus triporus]|uniref:Uncharacterized protein n=1 Tax=Stephanodiscus triporus TaxID=2934178 RepID=A0ABD3QWM4_9STRA